MKFENKIGKCQISKKKFKNQYFQKGIRKQNF